jgi:hypothetical protein
MDKNNEASELASEFGFLVTEKKRKRDRGEYIQVR